MREAHPTDGWQVPANEKSGVCYAQPKTLADRLAIVNDFKERFSYSIPLVVDPMDNATMDTYAAWPERLYIIGADGNVAYKGAMGPQGFEPGEVETWLEAHPL